MTAEGVLRGAISSGRGCEAERAGVAIPTEAVELGVLVGTGTKPAAGPNVRGGSEDSVNIAVKYRGTALAALLLQSVA